ncbi:hypothetical protein BDQ17DRAFT_1537864 [Cyathus striatus]|nr:hypothetical protein BDQ17DRAFT_1537864 [Cyathus striatus]
MSKSSKTNGLNDHISSFNDLEAEITEISVRLSRETQVGEESADSNLQDVMEQLSKADGVAKDMENKLDGILGNLDALLASLEDKAQSQEAAVTQNKGEDRKC